MTKYLFIENTCINGEKSMEYTMFLEEGKNVA